MPSTPRKTSTARPTDRKPKTVRYGSSWKTPLTDLTLPSGEVCQVKRPGVQGLIKANVLHSLDSLTAIVQTETIPKSEGKPATDVEAIAKDPKKFNEMMEAVDKIVVHVVTQPRVRFDKVTESDVSNSKIIDAGIEFGAADIERDLSDEEKAIIADATGVVFVDWIDSVDKMFIMNFAVGGSADLAEFRASSEAFVGSVSTVQATAGSAE